MSPTGRIAQAPAGLAVSESGYLLRLGPTFLARGEDRELRFSIADAEGETVTEFDALHERRMHLIVVRRDGRGFRHLHPDMDEAGAWSFEARPFPPPAPRDATSGYEVRLRAGELHAGESSALAFAVGKGGEAVGDLAPYLGARGHLVALREGGLAFLHVHPVGAEDEHAHGGHAEGGGGPANEVAFAASFPTPGNYRLYLQFKHRGAVRTAQFTVSVPR